MGTSGREFESRRPDSLRRLFTSYFVALQYSGFAAIVGQLNHYVPRDASSEVKVRMFDLQPTLIGKTISLRPMKPADLEALYEVASDPLLWEQHPAPDRYQRPVFEEFFRESLERGGALVAFLPQTHEVIGSSRYYELNLEKKQVVIGYSFLARKFWGQGLNREMKKLMLDHVFLTLDTALFHVDEKNIRSQRALERVGITNRERIEKFKQRPDGSWRSSLIYRVSRP